MASAAPRNLWLFVSKDGFKKDSAEVTISDGETIMQDFALEKIVYHLDKYISLKSELKGLPITDTLGLIIDWVDGTTDTIPNNNGLVHLVKDVTSLDDTVQINKTDTTNFMWYMVALAKKSTVEWISQNATYALDGVGYPAT